MFHTRQGWLTRPWTRYGAAVVAVDAGFVLRRTLSAYAGESLPLDITFYPAVMVTALLADFGPGLLATVLSVGVADYWIASPKELFFYGSPAEIAGVVLFSLMGLFMCGLTEHYRRTRERAAAYEKELALRESREDLEKKVQERTAELRHAMQLVQAAVKVGILPS
jgi:K+-sensing histidine kinase KdpD